MQAYTITDADKGQRLDKYIKRRLPSAPSSFIYKMLRKKNITLNGKRASGSEIVNSGDEVRLFLSDETIVNFGGAGKTGPDYPAENLLNARQAYRQLSRRYPELTIVYEDEHIAVAYKPAGVLSQKAIQGDLSLNEWFLGLLLEKGEITERTLQMFTPSVQNRLDRNTEGLVLLAKTLQGSHLLTGLQREHLLQKYYQMIVAGHLTDPGSVEGWLEKDSVSNAVRLYPEKKPGAVYSKTEYTPLGSHDITLTEDFRPLERHPSIESSACECSSINETAGGSGSIVPEDHPSQSEGMAEGLDQKYEVTFVDAHLVTGKTHQLRAHFASIGHPILGDPKYGDPRINRWCRQKGIPHQLLICQRVVFPEGIGGDFDYLSGKMIQCELPPVYEEVMTRL